MVKNEKLTAMRNNVAFFFAILISIYSCQQERVNPEVPASAQEDTIKKEYPPKANHVTKHMATVIDSVSEVSQYADTMWWPYDNHPDSLKPQLSYIQTKLEENFGLTFESERAKVAYYKPDSIDMIAYPMYEYELVPVRNVLALD